MDATGHLGLADFSEALNTLSLSEVGDQNESEHDSVEVVAEATGADGKHVGQHAGVVDFSSQTESSPDITSSLVGCDAGSRNSREDKVLSHPGTPSFAEAVVSPAGLEPATFGLGNRRSSD